MRKCGICFRKSKDNFSVICGDCGTAWMRSVNRAKDGSVLSCMEWAARRARRYALKQMSQFLDRQK